MADFGGQSTERYRIILLWRMKTDGFARNVMNGKTGHLSRSINTNVIGCPRDVVSANLLNRPMFGCQPPLMSIFQEEPAPNAELGNQKNNSTPALRDQTECIHAARPVRGLTYGNTGRLIPQRLQQEPCGGGPLIQRNLERHKPRGAREMRNDASVLPKNGVTETEEKFASTSGCPIQDADRMVCETPFASLLNYKGARTANVRYVEFPSQMDFTLIILCLLRLVEIIYRAMCSFFAFPVIYLKLPSTLSISCGRRDSYCNG